MNHILLDIISPHWEEKVDGKNIDRRYIEDAQISILIDGKNLFEEREFKERFVGLDPGSFLYEELYFGPKCNKEDRKNATQLLGICSDCFFIGCDDLLVDISSDDAIVKWKVYPDGMENIVKEYMFDFTDYNDQMNYLQNKYNSYDWEDRNHKIRRLCNNYIKGFRSINGKEFDGVRILTCVNEHHDTTDKLSDIMEVYYYDDWEPMGNGIGRPWRSIEIKWDGETIENALNSLKNYAEKHLIKKK